MSGEMDVDVALNPGIKRKADNISLAITAPKRIKALDSDVVNKIAAGEIIVAPVHALKELIENSVDAGSTSLEILVKDGGLKLLQITDNGHGIDANLSAIGTYGFRGEALASISHIAHLTVTTKTSESNCAWRACYSDGLLAPSKPGGSADPKPTAGRQGTQITVEDLFFNMPTRRRAFRSASEEFNKILDVVGKYAIHCNGVAFSCKKHGESSTSLSTQANASCIDSIRLIYGSAVANELIEFDSADDRYGFKATGYASNANYHVKRTIVLLFINHRLVESTNIRKAVEATYSTFLPKGGHPFLYLSLEIDPQRVDVNVHPTKREVNFLNEDEIIEHVCNDIRIKLANVDSSRTFMTQSLLPGARVPLAADPDAVRAIGTRTPPGKTPSKPYENNLVRTDSKLRKITTMLPSTSSPGSATPGPAGATPKVTSDGVEYEHADREPVICRLLTVKELRAEVRDAMHNELTEIFAGHTFVGIVDERRRLAAVQGGVKLFLVDYGMVCAEYFYQVGLTDFSNFGAIRFEPPLDLRALLRLAAEHERSQLPRDADLDVDDVVDLVARQLIDRREMLHEYFTLGISDAGQLRTIPLLLKGYTPSLAKLPRFLLRLGPHVDWTDEKACFRSFLRELADYYVPEQLPPSPSPKAAAAAAAAADDDNDDDDDNDEQLSQDLRARRTYIRRVLEQTLFPAFAARLIATTPLMRGAVLEVANLKGLYRVFERC
ncbi:MAG: DNA mismatch repair protein [Claussenomyces sp. TS43310]|nr:MAG: DNA mismatch repair protein [Claussenomyces sp. TS43310]